MRFLSICSGIEAASVAWQPLGWKAVAFSEIDPFPSAVLAHEKSPFAVHHAQMMVRRLTPRECERLQGFPADYTAIPWRGRPADQCPDGPRYKAIGNSWAVPVATWIGARIDAVESLTP